MNSGDEVVTGNLNESHVGGVGGVGSNAWLSGCLERRRKGGVLVSGAVGTNDHPLG